ncbi:MAG: winged helix-turn-helix domain-containing protein, partial [Candidatus Aenigmatarchaeota archaeon]
ANHTEIGIPYQKKYEEYENVSKSFLTKFVEACENLQEKESFHNNLKEKKTILESLKDSGKSRQEIYQKSDISHPRLLNHLKSLASENMIENKDNPGFCITCEGLKHLEEYGEVPKKIEELSRIAKSDLRFVKVQDIKEMEGGTVYDFTTELETF